MPHASAYIAASDTEKTNLKNIFTNDDNVEIDYKGNKLFIMMMEQDGGLTFQLTDQNQAEVGCEYAVSEEGSYYYTITDKRFAGITLIPALPF